MMDKLWVVLLVALTGAHFGQGLPLRSTPHSYPHNTNGPILSGWKEGNLYAAVPALALIVTALGLLFGCTWCYRHKDCKQNEGAENQLFTTSATHLHERRSNPPDSGFSEPANNNISEDNNNGPISLREMQNIANNNATAYIVSENEERNRVSRESVVEFEPLPTDIRVADPLERCVDWFGDEDFPRNRLQYLREIGRGSFGRVVEGEIEDEGTTTTVAVKILNQNASLEDKARFLDEARLYRDASHENILGFVASCLQEDPWILIFELCSTDLQTYLIANRPNMAALNESGVPLRLMCDVTSALSYLHSRGFTYGDLCTRNVLIRGADETARAVLGNYGLDPRPHADVARHTASDVSDLGGVLRAVSAWGAPPPAQPDCPYREHLHQVMQLCWNESPSLRPSAAQVLALLEHLRAAAALPGGGGGGGGCGSDFEERWQRLKPNSIPKLDEHRAIVHAPSTSGSHFTGSEDFEPSRDALSVDMDTAVSRSSSIMSDRDPLSVQIKSESLNNLHGSLEDVRNIYLTHNEQAVLECNQGNIIEDREDISDASVDPWLKDIIAGSQDDVSYYKDVSDVIKNLDNILNSEKTSSSESSHHASPSRDNLSLDCKKDYPMQSSMVKSPGITNFQNVLEVGFADGSLEKKQDDDEDRDTIGTLSHSFERHSDTTSQHTLENLTPDTPINDLELPFEQTNADRQSELHTVEGEVQVDAALPKEKNIDNSDSVKTDLFIAPMHSVNKDKHEYVNEDCQKPSDNKLTDIVSVKETVEAKSISEVKDILPVNNIAEEFCVKTVQILEQNVPVKVEDIEFLPVFPQIVEDDKFEDLLPNTPLEQRLENEPRPKTKSANSQQEVINDLITPAKSTTDSKITGVDIVASEETSTAKVEQLDNVSKIAVESSSRLEENAQGNMPLPTEKNDTSELPESVQTLTTTPVIDSPFSGSDMEKNVEVVTTTVKKSDHLVSKSTEEEQVSLVEKEVSKTFQTHNTPKLVLSEVQDDIQITQHFDLVTEEFVDKLIKEAETMALSSIETVHTKVVPELIAISTNNAMDTFLNNEIQFLENSSANNVGQELNVAQDTLNEPKPSQEYPKENFLKEDVKLLTDSCLDSITQEILLDALQDVPKLESSHFFQEVDQPPIVINNLQYCENNIPEINSLPDVIREDTFCVDPPNEKQHHDETSDKEIEIKHVKPQVSLDLESTASADSSQSTFLIKDTLKEDSKTVAETPKEALLDEPVLALKEPKINTDIISNTFLDSEKELKQNKSVIKDTEPLSDVTHQNKDKEITVDESTIVEQNSATKHDSIALENGRTRPSNESTTYMDLADCVKAEIIDLNPMDENIKNVIDSCLETPGNDNCSLVKHEATEYFDLPNVIKDMDKFLQAERHLRRDGIEDPICSSTPRCSVDETTMLEEKSDVLSETKVPDYGPGVTLTKVDQQYVPDFLSPFDSPTKSHPTDTYDEHSSVVLGPFENCTMDLFKGVKSGGDTEIPKEEMLAFSSNFSEMNLETPSPLRDGNFLNEVPDIVPDDHSDDVSDHKDDENTEASDVTEESIAEKKPAPSTPPNSPGYFLASTSHQKYLVDIDMNKPTGSAPVESDSGLSSLHKEIELNQIELQITSKLAMAENENNLNIEYSGPLTVEGLVEDDLVREEESVPETFLAGNGGNIDDIRGRFTLDEDCVNALRNELELKLPLAQVAAIEPAYESEKDDSWSSELPPPPELVLSYPGALSPIAEETGPQLSAYENDLLWNASLRTESSESYPSPCNNSTEEPTEPPTGQDTYTLPDPGTQVTQAQTSSREITMSADSLNGSPAKTGIDDRTFTVEEAPCERISQVSPFVLSPTTDSSATNVTGVSTLSKTTQPMDVKPSETISKATSIDSWCSNDTLYNVEEAFDDLASDQDLPPDLNDVNDDSESDTLTLNEEKELSRISTHIVHDSKSDEDRFSPDSITAQDNDNCTYTKERASTKSEASKTKDLAYGTLTGPYSNCTTEIVSEDNFRLLPPPELVRRSPFDGTVEYSAQLPKEADIEVLSPKLKNSPCVNKMDSVEITCLEDHSFNDESPKREEIGDQDSPNHLYDMAGVTSTPLSEIPSEDHTASTLEVNTRTPENLPDIMPSYQSFSLSAELRHQETYRPSIHLESELLDADSRIGSDASLSFIEFIQAATSKPQDISRLHSSQNGSREFHQFENSVKIRPQDLSFENAKENLTEFRKHEPTLVLSPPSITNYKESHGGKNTVIITDLEEDQTEQPHSIIIAEISKEKDSPNRTFDSHTSDINHTYDSHASRKQNDGALIENVIDDSKEITHNGTSDESHDLNHVEFKSPEAKNDETKQKEQTVTKFDTLKEAPNGSVSDVVINNAFEIKFNGNSEKFATVNFISEAFEELVESNVDEGDKDIKNDGLEESEEDKTFSSKDSLVNVPEDVNGVEEKIVAVTEDFLKNEKKFCQLDAYLPLLSDIRFTGPASEIMSTSFTQDSPTDPPERDDKPGDNEKEWDSDSDSHSSNSSSGEFIWKGGDGQETSVVPTTQFDHRGSNGSTLAPRSDAGSGSRSASGSGSGSGSEGDEVEFVPSSWDCRAEPGKSSLRSLPHSQDNKKRVVFKRQKYHCVYEYPRELATVDADSPAFLPDLSTYTEWDPVSCAQAELGYGQLYGAPLAVHAQGAGAFGDYDEDFFISSSARPFESLGVMSSASQFFPGARLKPRLLDADSPCAALLAHLPAPAPAPSLDFTTPDSGVEDITPGSTCTDEHFNTNKLEEVTQWRTVDSGSSSESVSPSSPGGEALGGLRHTRDKLKLDLPPSPHIPSPRHSRVFNFVLDKPKRRSADERSEIGATPLVMTDDTPVVTGSLPVSDCEDVSVPEPTFSTFGKSVPRADAEQKIILTDEGEKAASPVKEPVRGEGTVLDSGDEDSGIESSSKATLERKTEKNVS